MLCATRDCGPLPSGMVSESRRAATAKVKHLLEALGADLQEEPTQPWRGAELMVLYYSEGEGKEIRLRKFVSAGLTALSKCHVKLLKTTLMPWRRACRHKILR